ncbi:MAG: dTDP-glucose 4,6-dehydratase [Nitrospirota bacterium]|jgi:dTDP-glucose 4,6-dehydratase
MKILVTGGAGFIGSEFVRQGVKRGFRLVVIDKLSYAGDSERIEEVESKLRFYRMDIANRKAVLEAFRKHKPDVVVNFAAETHVDRSILDPSPFLKANISGTFSLLEAARQSNNLRKFIHVSTDEVYGEIEKGRFTEESPLNPNSPYSASKASADMIVRSYQRTYNLPALVVRPSNNYGPWQYPEKLIPIAIIRALNNEPVPVYGKGLNVREWLYVEDCVEAVFALVEKGRAGEAYNVGSGHEKTNIEVVRTILELLGKPESLISFVKDRPGHDLRYSLDPKKIKKETGWQAKTDFRTGVEKTIEWYLAHKDWLFRKARLLKTYWTRVYVAGSK